MKKTIPFILLCLVFYTATAQQDWQFTHDMFNRVGTNIGSAGSTNLINATVINRNQWVGINFKSDMEGSPQTLLASVDGDINLKNIRGGVALTVIRDQVGFFNSSFAKAGYAHKIDFNNGLLAGGTLGLGLEIGAVNTVLSADWVWPESQEVTIPTEANGFGFDLGFGAYYYKEKFFLGISSSHLPQTGMKLRGKTEGETKYKYIRHYFITAGQTFKTPIPLIEISPSALIKTDLKVLTYSANLNIIYNNRIWGGASYRNRDAIAVLAGFELKNGIKFGYAYDITVTALARGSHEIMLSYSFDYELIKTPQRYRSVRFL